MKFLRRSYFVLLYALPVVLFFSYYPVIGLGGNASMNFELSLPLFWLPLFDIVAFVSLMGLKKEHNFNGISDRKFFLFTLFPLYATLSIFWSSNHLRAILTAGVIWLLFFAVFAIICITPLLKPAQSFRRTLLKTFLISSAIICLICWLQTILDVFGVSREATLLCPGCVSQTFGFPHPSGLAIEPQFMGNLLLAPTLLSLWMLTTGSRWGATLFSRGSGVTTRKSGATLQRQASRTRLEKIRVVPIAILACLFASTLFLTFSRGAIYAFAVALVVLIIFALVRHQFRPALIIIPIIAFAFTLTMQGIFNVIGPIHDSFCSGVTKSLNQLSLGIIDLRSACPLTPAQKSMIQQLELPEDMATEIVTHTQSAFDGYIAESTDIRLSLNRVALQTWLTSPRTAIFGAGLGSAGTAMHATFPEIITTPKEIVQNQPISLLLELGLFGIALIIFSLLLAFCPQIFPAKFVNGRRANAQSEQSFWRHPALPLLLSLIVAYFVTLQFFSGLPNALQIYLLPPLLYLVLSGNEKPIALSK